ncbi:ATP-dependent Clp protease ATP-binding subunit, partial [Chlamydiia bacterium]|nr:ATP-dependent Clp protease ATP-binding subunit [Chlamydiia bacterium]
QCVVHNDIEENYESVEQKNEEITTVEQTNQVIKLRDQEKLIGSKVKVESKENKPKETPSKVVVDEDDIATVVSKITGIPITRLTEDERDKVLNLNKQLKDIIIGQDHVVDAVCQSFRRGRADVKNPNKPTGAFLALGPSGVGKTYLAKKIAEYMFGDSNSLIRIDMSEYMEKFAVSRMTGSPPGYVGHEEGGQLTEQVRRRPYSVILFDEVEKAHKDVLNILLQVLEDGVLTDSYGRVIDFKNTIIIMTSNLGADLIRNARAMGFGLGESETTTQEQIVEKVMGKVRKYFSPEFLNRLDSTTIFNALSKADLNRILHLEVDQLIKRVNAKGITVSVHENVYENVLEGDFDISMGARPVRRKIERLIEDPLAEQILMTEKTNMKFNVRVKKGKIVVEAVFSKKMSGV